MKNKQPNRSQDIYGSAHKKAWEPGDDSRLPDAPKDFSWTRELSRYRMRNRLIMLGFVLLGGGLVFIIAKAHMASPFEPARGPMLSPYDAPTSENLTHQDPIIIQEFTPRFDPQLVLFTDELASLEESDPTQEPIEFNTHWIKQAAMHIIQAEKASQANLSDEAMVHYQKALEIFPNLQGVHGKAGLQHIQNKDFEKAAASFKQASQENEKSYAIANNLGVAYIQMDALDEAETMLKKAVELNPEYLPALFNLGTLYLKKQNLEAAAKTFEDYLAVKPTDIKASHRYAHTLLEMKDWTAASKVLTQLASYSPDSAPIFFRLAQALSHTDNIEGAISALRRGTSLVDARNALSWMSKNDFDRLRSNPEFISIVDELGKVQPN